MIGYMPANWATKFIVVIMQLLCTSIFSLIQIFCSTFMNLASLRMGTEYINNFMDRIYIVIGIIMLFKFIFSLFTSIINPDALTDKEKGFGKLIQRTVISLIMLIFVPMIFTKLLGWQVSLAKLVPRLIVGSEFENTETTNNVGSQLASDALKPFIIPNTECDLGSDTLEEKIDGTTNLGETLDITILTCEDEGGTGKNIFAYEFNGIIASVVGIIMIVILAGYCVDMAIRVIKLGILRVLAPIPIISYIDPKSEKGGAFGNWLKECISTYVELFIKLGIFYFVLEILGSISSESIGLFENSDSLGSFGKLFIIIGAFFFMGKAADFICNILGIKKSQDSGGLLKGLAGIGAAVGIGASVISSARTNYKGALASQAARGVKQNKGAAIASAILGGGAGLVTAGRAVAGAKSGKFGAALSATNKRNAAYTTAAAAGSTFSGKVSSYFQRAFTGETEADKIEREIKELEDNSKNIGSIVSRADDKAKTSKDTVGISQIKDSSNRVVKQISGNYQQWAAAFNAAKTQGLQRFNFNGTDVTMEEAEKLDFGLLTSNSECYIKNHGFGDAEFQEMIVDYEKNNPGKSVNASTTRKDMKDAIEALNVSKSQKSRDLRAAKANADATKPK